MRRIVLSTVVAALFCMAALAGTASASSPQNPYRSFNLSGVNYGSMEWERAQREGRRVWPFYNAPARASGAAAVSGPGDGRGVRRWRP